MKVKKADLRALVVAQRDQFLVDNNLTQELTVPYTTAQARRAKAAYKRARLDAARALVRAIQHDERVHETISFDPRLTPENQLTWEQRNAVQRLAGFDRDLALLDLCVDETVTVTKGRGTWAQYI